ncbi:MAG TPA: hypothetical protein VHV51_16375 [Polyangiaceae bacterium]|nr:hypothetical protein [Polyangiaceae bacterium]
MMRRLASVLLLLPLGLLGVEGCGGSAFDSGPGSGGSSGTVGNAGSTSAGSNSIAGSTSNGGSSSVGGTTSTGGTSATGGKGNAGGQTGEGGSGGVDITACSSSTECEVEPAGCCSCGLPPVSNFTAINSNYIAQYSMRCGAVDCAPCPPIAVTLDNPVNYYVPTCAAGHCAVVDLRTTDMTACSSASDCQLRAGTGCCPSCSGTYVALNAKNESELFKLECGDEPLECPACVEPNPGAYGVDCVNGRCSVTTSSCTSTNPCPL